MNFLRKNKQDQIIKQINNKIKKILNSGSVEAEIFKKEFLAEFISNKLRNLKYYRKIQANWNHSEYLLKEGCTDAKCELY